MDKLTPELIEEMIDEFFQGAARNIYLSADDDSYIFEGDEYSREDLEGTLCGYSYIIKNGAYKLCLIFDDFDEVIKINSSGRFTLQPIEDDDYYEERVSIIEEECCDFLEEEIKFYQTLDDSIKPFFLPNKFVMDYNGIKIYTQEKIKSTYSQSWFSKEELGELIEQYNLIEKEHEIPETELDIVFIEQIIQSYTNPFEILKIVADVRDLHGGNVGYTYNGVPVCHDYGGALY